MRTNLVLRIRSEANFHQQTAKWKWILMWEWERDREWEQERN